GRLLASGSQDKTIKLWDAETGRELRTLAGHSSRVNSVSFSPDGRTLASGSEDKTIKLWDVATGQEIRTLASSADSIFGEVSSVAISPDGRILAAGKDDHTVTLWDIATGQQIRTITGHTFSVNSVTFSPEGRKLASAGSDATVKLWDISTGQELRTFAGHTSSFNSVSFTHDGLTIFSGSSDGSIYFWNAESGGELARLVALQEIDWAVVDPQGRFDASPGGMQSLHWVAGMEVIALDQLKERYFDPGLLGKILGFNPEPLRDVSAFSSVTLYPEVKVLGPVDASGKLHIQLKNRGGGIGRIQVFVNGKELLADARGPRPDPSASESTLSLDLRNVPVLAGTENEIRIVPWNQEGYISGRGVKTIWTPEGAPNDRPPEFYAIIAGISRYQSPDIQLGFSAKDAEDMAHALDLGARRLFGTDHIHITILSTTGNPGVLPPTKANLQKAFEAAQRAQPGDVLVVYLAGHGLAVQDLYAYPTEEARSLDLSDPEIRRQTAVTSEELVEWIKKIPARHQVMILDTCAAGAAALKFVEKREVPGDQIRALDRLKDRTGFFVLMGSAADSVSYEASQYGQGLLTYSLLQGMRGAALKNDVEVDVSSLFEFAADRVPLLARDIGGIQKPQILPGTGGSFDVGLLKKEDKENIPLAPAKPMILRPVFINTRLHRDDLGLNAAIRKHLREETYASERGAAGSSAAIFFDQEDFPGAISPSGDYSVEGESVKVTVVLTRNDKELTQLTVEGLLEDPDALADKIVRSILAAITTAHASP
ncbi:MAG: caspase family protein, partial [Candidatus Acidiferrales bacterium]